MHIDTNFSNQDLPFLFVGLFFVLVSIVFYRYEKIFFSIFFLTIAAFLLRFFIVRLDPFIYYWDEQFHALVAKNMLSHPFFPMLYVHPVLPFDVHKWDQTHIWLHKPPLFLWLIAISFKIFGLNTIALRLPSVVMTSLMVPMMFRMGKIIVNEKVGYYSAFLFALANYQLEMVTGIIPTDHNDVAFMFFIAASFWAWFEYKDSGKKQWLYLIGIFSGMATLVKWIMGFLVFFCWGITLLCDKENRKKISSYIPFLKSGIVAFVIFIPWQIYMFWRFPTEAAIDYSSFSNHFTTALEGHRGDAFYHLNLITEQYGSIVPYLLVFAIYLIYKKIIQQKQANYLILLTTWLLTVYVFYTLVLTKMPLFTTIAAPVIFIVLGNLFSETIHLLETIFKRYAGIFVWILILVVGFFNLNCQEIEMNHTNHGKMEAARKQEIYYTYLFKKLDSELPSKDYVVFNSGDFVPPMAMFYSGMTVYKGIPDSITCKKLENEKIKLAIFDTKNLPNYLYKDSDFVKIPFEKDSL